MARKPKSDGTPPKTAFARTKKLVHLAADMGKKEVSHRIQQMWSHEPAANPFQKLQNQIEQAQMLVQALSQLKGAAMKAGQLLSIEGADFLPPEIVEILSKLQDGGTAMSFEAVQDILKRELGPERLALLGDLSETPVASASIGQVHSAHCAHGKVAIKVQFPGIADTIRSDLKVLGKICGGFARLTGREIDLDDLFEELGQVLSQETDYVVEGIHLEAFRGLLADCPHYVVPSFHPEFTTHRVLTMSFEEGIKLKTWMATAPSLELREHYGRLILDLYVKEFFENGIVQTDPNFANFLFRPDTKQLVVLDFGAVRKYSPEFQSDYRELLRLLRHGTPDDILGKSFAMDLVKSAESPECLEAYVEMLRRSVMPFDPARQPFNFADIDYSKYVREATMLFTRQVRHSAPPHQLIFLHRKLGGVFHMLKGLNVSLPLCAYWERIMERPPLAS